MQVMLCGTSSGSQKKEDIGGKEVEKVERNLGLR